MLPFQRGMGSWKAILSVWRLRETFDLGKRCEQAQRNFALPAQPSKGKKKKPGNIYLQQLPCSQLLPWHGSTAQGHSHCLPDTVRSQASTELISSNCLWGSTRAAKAMSLSPGSSGCASKPLLCLKNLLCFPSDHFQRRPTETRRSQPLFVADEFLSLPCGDKIALRWFCSWQVQSESDKAEPKQMLGCTP